MPRVFTYFPLQPIIHEIEKIEELNTSSKLWFDQVIKNTRSDPDLSKPVGSYADVRDVALANVLAVKEEAAGGHRILVATGKSSRHTQSLVDRQYRFPAPFTWQDMSKRYKYIAYNPNQLTFVKSQRSDRSWPIYRSERFVKGIHRLRCLKGHL